MPRRASFALTAVFALVLSVRGAEDGFVSLVQGNEPNQFDLVGIDAPTVKIDDGVITISGSPNGYVATKKSYRNYVLRFDWMYERPEGLKDDATFRGNSGLLLHITGPDKVWPKCIEVQLANTDAGNTFAIFGAKFNGKKDAAAQKKAVKPVGQWNEEVVTCKGDKITCMINGIEVATGNGASPDGGRIGWQSEGSLIRLRGVKIKSLD